MITLNHRDSRPIYEQIRDSFRNHIVQGAITPDEKLPSVRDLAGDLSINPNTIQRAYRELETEGYVYSIPGKGTFAASIETDANPRKTDLLATFDKIVEELLFLGVTPDEFSSRVASITQKKGGKSHD